MHVGALDDADAAAGQVERRRLHQPRVLGGLAADQRAAGLATAGRDRADELGDALRDRPADRDVVEEGERLGAAAHDVVGAHRHEVDADGVEAAERRRDGGLRADAVGRGDEQRLAVAGRDAMAPPNPPRPPTHLGPPRRLDVGAHQVDRPLAGALHSTPGSARYAARRASALPSSASRAPATSGLLEHELAARRRRTARAPGSGRRSRRSRTARTAGRARRGRRGSTGSRANRRR